MICRHARTIGARDGRCLTETALIMLSTRPNMRVPCCRCVRMGSFFSVMVLMVQCRHQDGTSRWTASNMQWRHW